MMNEGIHNRDVDEGSRGHHNNRSYRQFRITNFRNIGIDREERLTINRSSRAGELGDLTIIVGPNNSGKSNIMAAIRAYSRQSFIDADTPEWPVGGTRVPKVSFEVGAPDLTPNYEEVDGAHLYVGTLQEYAGRTAGITVEDLQSVLASNVRTAEYVEGGMMVESKDLSTIGQKLSSSAKSDAERIVRDICLELPKKTGWAKTFVFSMDGRISAHNDEEAFTGVGRFKIYNYDSDISYSQKDLVCDPLNPNKFCSCMLNAIGISKTEVANYYDSYGKMKTKRTLRMIENVINEKLESVSDRFNSMYYSDEVGYSFNVYLESNSMELNISKGNKTLKLDNQSTGFKWFFNFFFGLLQGYPLESGDIILMDEPATGLHVSGQIELRRFLKEFAVKNQVSFVIATHSPFLIDCDHLDEVRVVTRDENGLSHIENNFLTVDSEDSSRDSDKMDSILGALTVGRHIILPPDSRVVFVEGITDYNYLTAFKHLFGIEGITFLPIGGVKKDHLASKLRKIASDPILIVDSDKAGYIAKEKDGNGKMGIDVIALSDIDPSFMRDINQDNYKSCAEGARGFTIEDLFSKADFENIVGGSKESNQSAVIKTYIGEYGPRFSEETRTNFRKVFDYLKQEFME